LIPHTPPTTVRSPGAIKRVRQHHHFVSSDLSEVITTVELTLELRDVSLADFLRMARAFINEHPIAACIELTQPELTIALDLIPTKEATP
jgi:hypothetical protein